MRGRLFSAGSLVPPRWRPRWLVVPWLVAAGVLSVLSCWDFLIGGGRVDFILLGLAGYELVIGLTEEPGKANL